MNASFQQTLIFFLAVSPEKSNQISLDHEITLKILKFILNSMEKAKSGF